MTFSTLTPEQRDRAAGVLLGAACGDALGVPYEFASQPSGASEMIGGGLGPYEPGEYSDDTQMQVCVAEVATLGEDLRSAAALDGVAAHFMRWYREGASDIGNQTRQVFAAVGRPKGASLSSVMAAAAADLHARTGRSAGNGSLMRTSVVALPYLGDVPAMVEAARLVSGLTHHDDLAGDACVLWCSGVRRAVLDGTYAGVREGLALLRRHAATGGRRGWRRRRPRRRPASRRTASSCRRFRPRGRRSRGHPHCRTAWRRR